MLTPVPNDSQLVSWSAFVVAVLTALSKLGATWSTAKEKTSQGQDARMDKVWDRQDELIEDLRKDLAECRKENTDLRNAQPWTNFERRKVPRDNSDKQ